MSRPNGSTVEPQQTAVMPAAKAATAPAIRSRFRQRISGKDSATPAIEPSPGTASAGLQERLQSFHHLRRDVGLLHVPAEVDRLAVGLQEGEARWAVFQVLVYGLPVGRRQPVFDILVEELAD